MCSSSSYLFLLEEVLLVEFLQEAVQLLLSVVVGISHSLGSEE